MNLPSLNPALLAMFCGHRNDLRLSNNLVADMILDNLPALTLMTTCTAPSSVLDKFSICHPAAHVVR